MHNRKFSYLYLSLPLPKDTVQNAASYTGSLIFTLSPGSLIFSMYPCNIEKLGIGPGDEAMQSTCMYTAEDVYMYMVIISLYNSNW